ncbi:MAG TPA: hypothetical protein VHF01_17680 [Candidatus Acidoferrum sp.]|nr:hypothetical protein [Candidatus Acidoferrum sp.]
MRETRRKFVIGLAAGSFLAAGAELLFGQRHAPKPMRQQRKFPVDASENADPATRDPKVAKAAMLLQNKKEFREGVEHLSMLVNELREEVDKTATTDVLSVRMYKKAQEIEKLAKQIKNKAKG